MQQLKQLALWALKTLPEAGKKRQPFVRIKQEMKFLDRLTAAVEKEIDNEQARKCIFTQLAIENANLDCQKVLRPLRDANLDCQKVLRPLRDLSIDDMLNACMNVGSRQHDLSLVVEAFAALSVNSQQCFSCDQYGHLRRDCPKVKANNRRGTPGICSRCCKGCHYANQCRSKFDRDGQPLTLPGNPKWSVVRGRAMTANHPSKWPPHGAATVCTPAQAAAPEWTWPPQERL